MKEKNESENDFKEKEKENNNINNKDKTFEPKLKENKNIENNLKAKVEYDKERFHNSNNFFTKEQTRKIFYQQRHLFDHKQEKIIPLINIYSPNLQKEYTEEVNYIFGHLLMTICLSFLIMYKDYLILKNYKPYNEVVFSLIFNCFTFFFDILLIVELKRDALRDQIRYKLYKFFALLFSISLSCLFVSQIINTIAIFNKMKLKRKKDFQKAIDILLHILLGKDNIYDFLILSISLSQNIIFFVDIPFLIWLINNSLRILFGFDLEVFQKQILEDRKGNKENFINNKKEDEIIHKKQD